MEDPYSLPCNHQFCGKCILHALQVNSVCPLCKLPAFKRALRKNPALSNIITAYQQVKDGIDKVLVSSVKLKGTSSSNSLPLESSDNNANNNNNNNNNNTQSSKSKDHPRKEPISTHLLQWIDAPKNLTKSSPTKSAGGKRKLSDKESKIIDLSTEQKEKPKKVPRLSAQRNIFAPPVRKEATSGKKTTRVLRIQDQTPEKSNGTKPEIRSKRSG